MGKKRKKAVPSIQADLDGNKLINLNNETFKLENLKPMNDMWVGYIKSLLGSPQIKPDELLGKLVRADMHGSIISVFQAKNESLIGITGIVI